MRDSKFILFGTGAQFSIAVLDNLLFNGLKPLALALPEFAPSSVKLENGLTVEAAHEQNKFVLQATRLSIPLLYLPESRQSVLLNKLAAFNADFYLIACWPYLLNPEIVNAATGAALNMHPSLLPDYRGAAPVVAQIQRQERNLGVSLHLLSDEFDKGDIVDQIRIDLKHQPHERNLIETEAARAGVGLFIKAINNFGSPEWQPRPQPN